MKLKFHLSLFGLLVCLCAIPVFANERPNILLIVSEDNGQELGCYGDPYVQTPVLDKLAREGLRFHNAYVPQAGCSQSRAALLTGLYPHQNGQIGLATWKFRMYREDTPNLVNSLKLAGYRTGIIGKLHVNPASAFPFDFTKIPSSNFNRKHLADYAKQAESFFKTSEKPFFLSINYPDAHRPFLKQVKGLPKSLLTEQDVKPLKYFGLDNTILRAETANYYNCLSRLDSLIGDLLDALHRSGKAESTLVIYLGDHGADLLRGKRTSYEGGLRIPLILRWPKRIQPNQVRTELVSTIDLMPTLISITRAKRVDSLPGRSLVPLFEPGKPAWRQFLYTEFHLHSAHNFFPQRTVRNSRFKLIQNLLAGEINPGYEFTLNRFYSGLSKSIESSPEPIRLAYQRMKSPPEYELYDLKNDPYEFQNLATDNRYASALKDLKRNLNLWRHHTNDPLLKAENLQRLQKEIEACFVKGKPNKASLELTYPDYFFTQ